MKFSVGQKCVFDYPEHYTMYPDLKAHSGQSVEIVRQLETDEGEENCYRIRAADGWEGDAFESELTGD